MPASLYPLPGPNGFSRRSFLAGSASFAAAALLSTRAHGAVITNPKFSAYPFSLGVASGDPLPDGVVLWTRLAPRPLETGGGMGADPIVVSWQIAEDETMSRVVQSGTATARADWSHSVHVEVNGLRPDRWYWYQFKTGGEVSAVGRTRTTPLPTALPDRMRFAFVSCQHYEAGLYTAYDHLSREDIDLVVHLGDYIYEGAAKAGQLREHLGGECISVDDYRLRYARYKTDPKLQAAHAMAPWVVTWDDHEVANNYADEYLKNGTPRDEFLVRRAAGYQAYFEHMPLRRSSLPRGPDMLLYRGVSFGRLAQFHVLDTRQYRTPQQLGDGNKTPTPVLLDPNGTLLGDKQRQWLFDGLERSPANWNVLTQQVMMARVDRSPGPKVTHSMDQWPGYEFERRRVLKHFHDQPIKNPVVLTGDIHKNWANELIADFDQLDSKVVGTEFVGTSISSGGDGGEQPKGHDQILAENPFVKLFNGERGYVRCELTPETWRADYRTVPYVTRSGAPVQTRASFVVESDRPGLNRV
ncbi:MAG: alkaline phosphatase D family protein [Opitutaceae bacterium]|tara:strand:+ start:793 stop:2370 length:1578 start_codon:yes stop_codon:yes gene_type:complete